MRNSIDALWRRRLRRGLIVCGLEASALLARAGIGKRFGGAGAIFALHHVRPVEQRPSAPNRHLEITPDFLESVICRLAQEGYDVIRLEDVPQRLTTPQSRPFACFTLDDGYRDNRDHALPVFERHGVPFTLFVTRGFAERTHSIWWETLADLLNARTRLRADLGRGEEDINLSTAKARLDAFDRFARRLRQGDETETVAWLDGLASRHGIDPLEITRRLTLDGGELAELARHPLVTLGAHTLSHRALGRLAEDESRAEMQGSADWLAALTGRRPATLAYPYGSAATLSAREPDLARTAGFTAAVTTQPGVVTRAHAAQLTALPRISLNGYYQRPRYVTALAAGIPFRLTGQRAP
ncbi:polysaccharide deacetylase family protein [Rhizobium straminoryzae]|uniref:Chitooligosaccharide deacetylase n=1 Tax=Rhizobium straminoryzae TaxID=1387186 RepID=A0A549TBU5_9HYPH|nr:polysaccharide deacetylase family protein [Rhizobium straminoryzae]TRL39367.1 polysaccharide deacetylase family protein [Rhizobium straminoryzae]